MARTTRKRTNALWFFVALLGGGAGIWWTKSAFADAWIAAVVAAGVVLALTVYYVLNDEDAPEEEGDNVYYLGLLFTLISLMFSLVELFGADTDIVRNAGNFRGLLENFGIALTSTVVGIAGRIAVQNWQRTASAGETELADDAMVPAPPPAGASSHDLEMFNRHLLGRIARDLTQGANALARFHRIVRSHASDTEDHLRNHSEAMKRESAEFKDALERNAEAFTQELRSQAETTLDAVGRSLTAAAKQAEDLPARLQSAHDGYVAEVRELTHSFHDEVRSASGKSLETLQQNFEAAAKQSLSLTQSVSTAHERIDETLDRLRSGLGDASDASAALGNSARDAAKSTTILVGEVDKLRTNLAEIHTRTDAMTGLLDAMLELDARMRTNGNTVQTAAAVRKIGEFLQTMTADAAAAAERAAKAAELFDTLAQSVQMTQAETQRAADALRILANAAEARTESLSQRPRSGVGFWKRGR